jgi:hypothetical protein
MPPELRLRRIAAVRQQSMQVMLTALFAYALYATKDKVQA